MIINIGNICCILHVTINQFNQFFWSRETYISSLNILSNKICFPEVEESALSLPDEVLRSLLSRNVDAKDVIARLLEVVPLKQESLENPQPETKHFVRNLARFAKEMNRFDVFQFLRENTPAGTTGNFISCKLHLMFGDNFCV